MIKVKAVLMAGGFGTRIQPLTSSIPKPMLPVTNIPMMEHILIKLKSAEIDDIIVLLYFKPDIIREYFGNGSRWGINITYVMPDNDYGTAGAVGCAREYLDTTFIVVSGDLVTDFDFAEIVNFHENKNSALTVVLTSVENPLQFGVVITDESGKICRFLEKPSWGETFSDMINTGIYVIEPEILSYIPKNERYDFSMDLFPNLMNKQKTLWGCKMDGYWRDVGNPKSYREVQDDILKGVVKIDIPGKVIEKESAVIYLNSKILPEAINYKGTVVIGRDVRIGADCKIENCSIGDKTTIGKGVNLKDCVLWNDVSIGSKSVLRNTVVCSGALIGSNVRIKHGAIIAEECRLGDAVHILKDITIWPNKILRKSSVVASNIVWGESYNNELFREGRVTGTANIELTAEIVVKIAEAFGSAMPVGSTVYVSGDYHRSSSMLKRSIIAGLLATGVNVTDVSIIPSSVMRRNLFEDKKIKAGIHLRQSVKSTDKSNIIFFNSDGILIDTNSAKGIERIYFREQFRRVNQNRIGRLFYSTDMKERYEKEVIELINVNVLKEANFKLAVDLAHGMTSDIYPDILNRLDIDNIMIDANASDKMLEDLNENIKKYRSELSNIVKSLGLDMGIMIYPNGQRLEFISDDGMIISKVNALMIVLYMLHLHDKKIFKIFLPAWAPDILDNSMDDIEITRGKLMGKSASYLEQFDLIADVDSHFAFGEFSFNSDAIFASLKIMELLAFHKMKFSQILVKLPKFYYKIIKIVCPSNLKGKMMRQFLDEGEGKNVSHKDGIKIQLGRLDWILMIPDDSEDILNIYIQAETDGRGLSIKKIYIEKIEHWLKSYER